MREFKVRLVLEMDYNADSKEEVERIVDEEFSLGDKYFELDIEEYKTLEITHKDRKEPKSEVKDGD